AAAEGPGHCAHRGRFEGQPSHGCSSGHEPRADRGRACRAGGTLRAPSDLCLSVRGVMAGVSTDHGTVAVERVLDVPLAQAYRAFTDANERARWGAPSDTATFIYEA